MKLIAWDQAAAIPKVWQTMPWRDWRTNAEDSSIVLLAAQLYKLGVLQKLCVSFISGRLCRFCLLRAHGIRARQLRAQVKKSVH